jgi:TldD protein
MRYSSRRQFLDQCGAGAAAWATLGISFPARAARGDPPDADQRKSLAAFALEAAAKAGASYVDIRINRYQTQNVFVFAVPDLATGKVNVVPNTRDRETFGFGVRVLADGAWGFAASDQVNRDEIAWAAREAVEIAKADASLRQQPVKLAPVPAYRDTYQTPVKIDPFSIPTEQKLAMLTAAALEARKVSGVFSTEGGVQQRAEHRFFASTVGSVIEQHGPTSPAMPGASARRRSPT